ncbi:MAG: polysaccharide pyruvyl transferase CsaB [Clostridia bacterium]
MADIIISGYYGLGNSGDEALLKSIVDNLRSLDPDVRITALSGNAEYTRKTYGINTVNRFNPFAVLWEMRKAKLLISGGGSLIQDATSTKSLLYYLAIISAAKALGLKVMLYANGMGPISDKNVSKVTRVLNKVDLITLRENVSMNEIVRCKVTKPRVEVTADPAYLLKPCGDERTGELLRDFGAEGKKLVAISVREWKTAGEDFEKEIAAAADMLCEDGYLPVFFPMQTVRDLPISQSIRARMKHGSALVDKELSVSEMLGVIGACRAVIGMRLHSLIFASSVNVPMIGIIYDPKIRGSMDYMNQPRYIEAERVTARELYAMTAECLNDSGEIRKKLAAENEILREKANKNAVMALELLKEGK